MRTIWTFLGCFLVITLTGCSGLESQSRKGYDFYQIDKVAVADVVGLANNESAKNQIADFFVIELLKKGYSPIQRSQVQAVLNEQNVTASEVTKIGQLLDVPAVLLVSITESQTDITLSAKMLTAKDNSILWMGTDKGSTDTVLGDIYQTMSDVIVNAASENSDTTVNNDSNGFTEGNRLNSQQEKIIRQLVSTVCRSLPHRR